MKLGTSLLAAAVVVALTAATPTFASTVIFSDDFESSTLNANPLKWTEVTGDIVTVNGGNPGKAMKLKGFDGTTGAIDTSAATTTPIDPTGPHQGFIKVSFDYLGSRTEDKDTLTLFAIFGQTFVPLLLGKAEPAGKDLGTEGWLSFTTGWISVIADTFSLQFAIIASAGTEFALIDNVKVAAVPAPAALPLLAAGLGALGVVGWRKKKQQNKALA